MTESSTVNQQKLLSFLYQTPYGVISADDKGNIDLMNPYATRILMPLVENTDFTNFFSILNTIDPDLSEQASQYGQQGGVVFEDDRRCLELPNKSKQWLDLTLVKLNGSFMLGMADSNLIVERETKAREEAEKRAEEAARLEMATSVIHDIGNAVTSVGINAAELLGKDHWSEIGNIDRVLNLLQTNLDSLNDSLSGKGDALINFLKSIEEALSERQQQQIELAQRIAQNVHHIQDIIRIQKQFARDGEGAPLKPINIMDVMYQAQSISANILLKSNIKLEVEEPKKAFTVNGDQTQLTQVFVNILKNAAESIITDNTKHHDLEKGGEIKVSFHAEGDSHVSIQIKDSGSGFNNETADQLAAGSFTSKQDGSGIGLRSCHSILTSHFGHLQIFSDGEGKGCTVHITLPIQVEPLIKD